jgi:AraC family transcriptional regulator of arabinose operon
MEPQLIIPNLQTELIIGHRTICDEKWALGGRVVHSDPFSRLYWIQSGTGEIIHSKGTIKLCPGKLFAIPAHTPARYRATGKMVLYWIHFRARLFGCMEIFSLLDWGFSADPPENVRMDDFWETIIMLCRSRKLDDSFRADGMLRELLACFATSDEKADDEKILEIQRFLPAISFIEQNIHRKIRLEDLAKVVSLQPAYFCHLFSITTGQSPIDFINRKRIERAQFLLLGKKMTLKETAAEVGFKDVYYFSRIFKKMAGISPANYRLNKKHSE